MVILNARILVCGGRFYGHLPASSHPLYEQRLRERKTGLRSLDEMLDKYDHDTLTIIHGGATGGDSIAAEWAKLMLNESQILEYKALWTIYGKKAGFIRNKRMLDEGKPTEVWYFPGGTGTNMMRNLAFASHVETKPILK